MADTNLPGPSILSRAVTLRAVLLGLAIAAAVGLIESHINAFAAHHPIGVNTAFIHSNMPMGAVFPVFAVLVIFNLGLSRWWPPLRLGGGELAVVFALALASTTAPLFFTIFMIGMFTGPHYFARSEPAIQETVLPHVPWWMSPSDENQAVTWYFEGLPPGQQVPWRDWTAPLLAWGALGLAVVCTCYCLVALMRRQWAERERLAFPLVALPREMISCTEAGIGGRPLLRNLGFWAGFLVPFAIAVLGALHSLAPDAFPAIPLELVVDLGSGTPWIHLFGYMFFVGMGFAYLTPLNVSLSIWLFFWMIWAEQTMLMNLGISPGVGEMYQWAEPWTSWQCFGALMTYTVAGLWMARRHLGDVVRKALWNDHGVDDSQEFLSYRTAFFGAVAGTAAMMGWLAFSGMEWKAVAIVVPAILLCYLAVAKIVAQTGLIQFTLPGVPQRLIFHGLGSSAVTPQTMTALGFSYGWFGDVQSTFISAATQGTRLTSGLQARKRWIGPGILLAFVVAGLAAGGHTILAGYRIGALNFDEWPTRGNFIYPFKEVLRLMHHPEGPDWTRLGYFFLGGAGMTVLMLLAHVCPWWPVHPVGFAVGSTFPLWYLWMPFFVAWSIKALALRVGGVRAYRSLLPAAIGLILGQHVGWGLQGILLLALTLG
ncbi:MAG: hypothetical protein HYU36_02205 [Planctomycetes bacterium]|nr:hypothetical protein [Planctomycetota bacterium]